MQQWMGTVGTVDARASLTHLRATCRALFLPPCSLPHASTSRPSLHTFPPLFHHNPHPQYPFTHHPPRHSPPLTPTNCEASCSSQVLQQPAAAVRCCSSQLLDSTGQHACTASGRPATISCTVSTGEASRRSDEARESLQYSNHISSNHQARPGSACSTAIISAVTTKRGPGEPAVQQSYQQ